MTVPEWMPGPPAPKPGADGVRYPWVLEQRAGPPGIVYVTFALPGLERAVVSVPEAAWLAGEHLPVGGHLAGILAGLAREPASDAVPRDQDDAG